MSDLPTRKQADDLNALVNEHSDHRVVLITETAPEKCDLCGVVAETRPYGPNGENVCFECGMKDEAAARAGFMRRVDGKGQIYE
jgi:hypothetical protein